MQTSTQYNSCKTVVKTTKTKHITSTKNGNTNTKPNVLI